MIQGAKKTLLQDLHFKVQSFAKNEQWLPILQVVFPLRLKSADLAMDRLYLLREGY